jgi:hypothetical protein
MNKKKSENYELEKQGSKMSTESVAETHQIVHITLMHVTESSHAIALHPKSLK